MATHPTDVSSAKSLVRMVVASPDRTRVLARPGGLALWNLPRVAVERLPDGVQGWTEDDLAHAEAVIGGPALPTTRLTADAWEFSPTGRIIAAGRTWIPVSDADRFGADAHTIRRWVRGQRGDELGGLDPEVGRDPSADGPSTDEATSR